MVQSESGEERVPVHGLTRDDLEYFMAAMPPPLSSVGLSLVVAVHVGAVVQIQEWSYGWLRSWTVAKSETDWVAATDVPVDLTVAVDAHPRPLDGQLHKEDRFTVGADLAFDYLGTSLGRPSPTHDVRVLVALLDPCLAGAQLAIVFEEGRARLSRVDFPPPGHYDLAMEISHADLMGLVHGRAQFRDVATRVRLRGDVRVLPAALTAFPVPSTRRDAWWLTPMRLVHYATLLNSVDWDLWSSRVGIADAEA